MSANWTVVSELGPPLILNILLNFKVCGIMNLKLEPRARALLSWSEQLVSTEFLSINLFIISSELEPRSMSIAAA